ncbi:hypothetical protein LTR62_000100 [Meristemomyces frigidus]|uniref:Aminoglycoside phosphotransferase domain-containing protein n=1 Tax=Meristemomyces frigidus TaxID=1508187 RepID=A0AAN7TJ37_9PEZI|nr:hypothetical protein LTR62_000100 [Meristemomyces frigidus]
MATLTFLHKWLRRKLEDLLFPLRMRLGRKIMYGSQRQIVQVSSTELIKGPCTEQEVEAMRYVAARTAVPLPRIHRLYRRREGLYIAMEFVRGKRLDKIWVDLDSEGKKRLVREVSGLISLMKSVPVPRGLGLVVASIEGGVVRDGIWGPTPIGPFASFEEFRSALRKNPNLIPYRHLWDRADQDDIRAVLTHADIAPRNIIRRDSDGVLVFIDWELAGWWPDYWEHIKWQFSDFPPLPGWVKLMDEMLPYMS